MHRSTMLPTLLSAGLLFTACSGGGAPVAPVTPATSIPLDRAGRPPVQTLAQDQADARAWLARRTEQSAGYQVVPNIFIAAGIASFNPAQSPNGANTGCRPSLRHPRPLVLVNGTFANMEDDYGALAPILANAGYCVFAYDYGGPSDQLIQSVGAVPASAQALATEVGNVLASTGVAQVDLVGHSQGGMLTEYYAKILGGAKYVHDIVALSPTTHGTTLDGLTALAQFFPGANDVVGAACQACVDQEMGSAVIGTLDAGPIAQSGVSYTVIETRNEEVVTPVGSSFIRETGVTNEYVQSSCPFDAVDHADLPYDLVTVQLVENALDPTSARSPNCWTEFPGPA